MRHATDGALAVGIGFVSPLLGVGIGSAIGGTVGLFVFPIISTALFYPLFLRMARADTPTATLAKTMVWVVTHSVVSIALAHHDLATYEGTVVNGASYRHEMIEWLDTGIGAESEPTRFVPQHALHFGAFLLLCWISRSSLGLLLGVLLLNYMNAYVGAVTLRGDPWILGILAWHPWAVIRVVGFLLAAILVVPPRPGDSSRRSRRTWPVVAALLIADLLLKTALAPTWREVIQMMSG